MDPARPPAVVEPPPAAPMEAPIGWGDKLVIICFLVGVALFGAISLIDLLANLFRD